jgi:hypothetical protein
VLATSNYGIDFPAVVARDGILAVQFHPEKSQTIGLRMIENWVRRCLGRGPRLGQPAPPPAGTARGEPGPST